MTYYLKNTSGTTINVIDLGISLPDGQSLVIDSNGINAYLSSDMQAAVSSGNLILSTTDIGDNGGDMIPADATAALSITSRYDRDNPHSVTATQALDADSTTDITISNLNELSDGGETALHIHDDRYYTEAELSTSNTGIVQVHWDNITNPPQFGSLEWKAPAIGNLIGKGTNANMPVTAEEGQFYLSEDDDHLYRYESGSWVDQGAPSLGDRVVFKDGVGSDDKIYEWDGITWVSDPAPLDNWAIVVLDDGDGKSAQYVYNTDGLPPDWIKIADVDWGSHDALADRDSANSHPGTAISYNNTASGLSATTIQAAIDEIAIEQGVDLDNIVFVAKNGADVDPNVTLGTIANPYLTIQAAIDSITTASSTNRFVVYVMPGDYNENVTLSKSFVFLASANKSATRIISSSGNTLALGSTTEKATGVYNISVVSNSSTTTDNAVIITGNNPTLFNVDINSPSGARTLYVNGAYNQTLRHVDLRNGTFRVDAGVIEFYDSKVIEALTNITSGTLRVHNGDFSHNGGDAIEQSGGTVYLVSAKLSSGSGSLDFNQGGGTVYWGWVEYDEVKVVISGTKTLLFPSGDLYYNSTGNTQIAGDDIQEVIDEIDVLIQDIIDNSTTHEGDTANPHSVTFTQAVLADVGTDITVAEAETLTDGSNADLLHTHEALKIGFDSLGTGIQGIGNVQDALEEIDARLKWKVKSWIYVDKNRMESYLENGSQTYPFKTIAAALAVATNGTAIYVSEGSYTENIVLPEGVSIFCAGLSKTYINGTITTTGTANARIGDFSLYGKLTITSKSQVENLFVRDQVEIAALGGDTGVDFNNVSIKAATGVALTVGSNMEQFKFTRGYIISEDGSSAFTSTSGISALDKLLVKVDVTPSANPAILMSGSSTLHIHQSIVQSSGGDTIVSSASNTYPNIISDVQYAGGEMDFNNSPTIVEGVHDIGGSNLRIPTGNALVKRPGEQIDYTPASSGLTSTNVQGAIDELANQITSFEMPSGTTFPTSPAPDAGDIFYRTDLNTTFQYDGSRSKWLSMTQMFLDWGSNVADGKYLNIHGATATQTGYLMPYNGTIISITAKIASGNQSKSIEIRKNNDRVNILDTFTPSSGSYSSITKNVDFAAGDYLQAFVPSAGVPAKDVVVMAVVCWRE